jgi:hypothetical protein
LIAALDIEDDVRRQTPFVQYPSQRTQSVAQQLTTQPSVKQLTMFPHSSQKDCLLETAGILLSKSIFYQLLRIVSISLTASLCQLRFTLLFSANSILAILEWGV